MPHRRRAGAMAVLPTQNLSRSLQIRPTNTQAADQSVLISGLSTCKRARKRRHLVARETSELRTTHLWAGCVPECRCVSHLAVSPTAGCIGDPPPGWERQRGHTLSTQASPNIQCPLMLAAPPTAGGEAVVARLFEDRGRHAFKLKGGYSSRSRNR